MAKYDKKKLQAEELFIINGHTAKEIAELIGVAEKTVGEWRKVGEWDARRDELLTSPAKIRELLNKEAFSLAGGNKAQIDADSLSKVMSAIDKVSKRLDASSTSAFIQELDTWYAQVDPEQAIKQLEMHKQFLMYKIRQESGD